MAHMLRLHYCAIIIKCGALRKKFIILFIRYWRYIFIHFHGLRLFSMISSGWHLSSLSTLVRVTSSYLRIFWVNVCISAMTAPAQWAIFLLLTTIRAQWCRGKKYVYCHVDFCNSNNWKSLLFLVVWHQLWTSVMSSQLYDGCCCCLRTRKVTQGCLRAIVAVRSRFGTRNASFYPLQPYRISRERSTISRR